MTNPTYTHISVLVDRSGSMSSIRSDAEGGLRAFLSDQRSQPGRLTTNVFQFDTEYDEVARTALGELAEAYAYPLYAFARRLGRSPDDARDLVQSFFAELIEKDGLVRADPERGRFRTFLLTAFRNHASKQRDREQALKRGGGQPLLSLDADDGERRYAAEPEAGLDAERLYERRFALVLLDRAEARLAARYRATTPEKAERFAMLRPCLDGDGPSYRILANRLGLSETAVKVAVHRLRGHFREALRAEVADTLAEPSPDAATVDAEIRTLRSALGTN